MEFINLAYTFLLGILSQKALYKFNVSIKYTYSKIYQEVANILTGIFFGCFWMTYGYSIEFFIYSLCATILISTSIIDSFYLEIADEHNLMILLLGITYSMTNPQFINNAVLGGLTGGGIYLILAIISNGGIGGGDIKLAAATGLLLGPQNTIICIYYTFFISIIGFFHNAYKAFENKKTTKRFKLEPEIAFGPYIVTTVLMLLLRII